MNLNLQKTHGIKHPTRLFPWIPPNRKAPPPLHIITLGVTQKGLDIVKKCSKKYKKLEELQATIYTELHV